MDIRLEKALQVATGDPAFHLPSRKSVSNQVQHCYDAGKQAEVDVLQFLSAPEEKASRQVTATGLESARTTMAAARRLPPSLNHHCSFADSGFGDALAKVSHFKHSPANKEELHTEPAAPGATKTATDAGCFHTVEFSAGYDLFYSRGSFLLQTSHFTSISAGKTPNAGDCPLAIKVNKTNFEIDLLLVSLKSSLVNFGQRYVSFSIVLNWNVIKCFFFQTLKVWVYNIHACVHYLIHTPLNPSIQNW